MPDVSVKGLLIHIVRAIGTDRFIFAVADVLLTLAQDEDEKYKENLRKAGNSIIDVGVRLENSKLKPGDILPPPPPKTSKLPILGQ